MRHSVQYRPKQNAMTIPISVKTVLPVIDDLAVGATIDPKMCGQPSVCGRLLYGACAGVVHPGEVVVRSKRWGLAVPAGVLVAVLALAGCTSTTAADGTETSTSVTATSSPDGAPASPSLASASPSAGPIESSTTSTIASSNPWPTDLTPDQVAQAQAAIAAYEGYMKLVALAYTDPGRDWSAEAARWAADPFRSNLLSNLAATAQLGQYRDGSFTLEPTVTKVEPGVVTLSVCVDARDVGFYDKSGTSIKAPDAPGTYFRHLSTVTIGEFQGDQWLVSAIVDDYDTTC